MTGQAVFVVSGPPGAILPVRWRRAVARDAGGSADHGAIHPSPLETEPRSIAPAGETLGASLWSPETRATPPHPVGTDLVSARRSRRVRWSQPVFRGRNDPAEPGLASSRYPGMTASPCPSRTVTQPARSGYTRPSH